MRRTPPPRQSGFTLLEMVVALAISAVLVGFVTYFVTAPMNAYTDHAARSRLTASSENIGRMMVDDLRRALPNSVRIRSSGNLTIVEMLFVSGMGYFQPQGVLPASSTNPALLDTHRGLDFAAPDDTFSVFGSLAPGLATTPFPSAGTLLQKPPLPSGHLVIGNRGYQNSSGTAYDAYRVSGGGARVITPTGMQFRLNKDSNANSNEETVTLSAPFRFLDPAPANGLTRVFWVQTPVSYICNANANARTLRRYIGYPITATPPANENAAQLGSAQMTLVADNIASCRFACADNDVCPGMLVIDITVSQASTTGGDESVRIFEQVALDNAR